MADSNLNSTAVWERLAKKAKLTEHARARFTLLDYNTIAAFGNAIECNGTPGDDAKYEWLTRKGLPAEPPAEAELVAERTGFIRRLWKDCFTSVNDALRTSLANRDSSPLVQLMPAERHARMEEQKDRLDVLEWDDHTIRVGPHFLDKCS